MRPRLTRTRGSHTQEGGRSGTRCQYKAKAMKKPFLTTLLAATVASAILAAPGGAGKPDYSAPCVVGTGGLTTVTWTSGTSSAHVVWRAPSSAALGEAEITVTTHGPDSAVVDTPPTVRAGDTANVTYSGKKTGFALGVCTAA